MCNCGKRKTSVTSAQLGQTPASQQEAANTQAERDLQSAQAAIRNANS